MSRCNYIGYRAGAAGASAAGASKTGARATDPLSGRSTTSGRRMKTILYSTLLYYSIL